LGFYPIFFIEKILAYARMLHRFL